MRLERVAIAGRHARRVGLLLQRNRTPVRDHRSPTQHARASCSLRLQRSQSRGPAYPASRRQAPQARAIRHPASVHRRTGSPLRRSSASRRPSIGSDTRTSYTSGSASNACAAPSVARSCKCVQLARFSPRSANSLESHARERLLELRDGAGTGRPGRTLHDRLDRRSRRHRGDEPSHSCSGSRLRLRCARSRGAA